jgi:autophagy-related protein 5
MADDREVLREVWESCLPVSFSLSPDEVVTLQRPDPFYLMVPRVSYFSLVMDRVIKYFIKFIHDSNKSGQDIWLDFEGQKLKWFVFLL